MVGTSERKTRSAMLSDALTDRTVTRNLQSLSEFVDRMIAMFGGPREFANELHRLYLESSPVQQVRVMAMICNMVEGLQDRGLLDGADFNPSELDDEQIDAEIKRRIEEMALDVQEVG